MATILDDTPEHCIYPKVHPRIGCLVSGNHTYLYEAIIAQYILPILNFILLNDIPIGVKSSSI